MSTLPRITAPDLAKSLGILLVVVGHVLRGVDRTDILNAPEYWQYIDKAIYLFHMPLFFYLAGLFFENTTKRLGYKGMMTRYARVLIPPLVVWSYLQQGLQYFSSASNIDISLMNLIFSPIPPKQQFWFIGALLIMCASVGFLITLEKSQTYIIGLLSILLIGAALTINDPAKIFPSGWSWYLLRQTFYHFPYFLIGIVFAHGHVERIKLGAVSALGIFALSLAAYMFSLGQIFEGQVYILSSVVCVISLYKFFVAIQDKWRGRTKDWAVFIGMNSMIIYVSHIIFTAGFRTVLMKLGVFDPSIHLVAGTAVGMIGPLAMIPFSVIISRKITPLVEWVVPYKLLKKEERA